MHLSFPNTPNLLLLLFLPLISYGYQSEYSQPILQGENIELSDDGSWCWFQDNRALLLGNKVLFTGVTSTGTNTVTEWDFSQNSTQTFNLSEETLPADDHNVATLMIRPDGKLLSVYSGHSIDNIIRYRISDNPGDISSWSSEKLVETNGRVCYSNLYRLSQTGETFNFYRGNQNNPHFLLSKDDGTSWEFGGRLFEYFGRSYLRYASDGNSKIHFITTEDHPRHYNNSIYHGYYENGDLYRSDGTLVGPLSRSTSSPYKPTDFTLVYNGDASTRTDVAWTSDIKLDAAGNPYVVFSVTKDPITRGETRNTQLGGFDHRYHYAVWDGRAWKQQEIAYAGSRLYPGENEYTGLISLHPLRKDVVYISADVNPKTGKPLEVNGESRYEIFRGEQSKDGVWEWVPVTYQSTEDNIRPIVLADGEKEVVLWLNGRYTTYKDYKLKVFGKVRFNTPAVSLTEKQKNSKKQITFLISEDPDNYEAPWTMPAFAAQLSKEKGYQTHVLLGSGPREEYILPAPDKIAEADLLVIFIRRVALPDEQLALIRDHLEKGKPIIGLRTANHAFSIPSENISEDHDEWWGFVPDVLGHENRGYGPALSPTRVVINPKHRKHPILKGIAVSSWGSQGNIYLIQPLNDKKAKLLLQGKSASHNEPVAFTRKVGKSDVFYTSLGFPTDFSKSPFIRLMHNAVDWALR